MLEKLISGGQTGADQGGLYAGRELGLQTGGTAPPGWLTDEGEQEELLRWSFGLVEGEPDPRTYPRRTRRNVLDSHGTLWVGNPGSPGGRLTLRYVREAGKPCIVNPDAEGFRDWIDLYDIEVLNVAGNRERKNPGIKDRVRAFLVDAILPMFRRHEFLMADLTERTLYVQGIPWLSWYERCAECPATRWVASPDGNMEMVSTPPYLQFFHDNKGQPPDLRQGRIGLICRGEE